ncbi:MAG: LysR family transcriptional regulator [Pigmentiphaga sp.]
MELRQLRYLIEVAEAGSINRAAERLGIAQSAISRQIAKLESELGVNLLRRTPEGVTLSAAGEQVLSGAQAVLREVEDLRRAVAGDAPSMQRVRIGMPPTVSGVFRRLFESPLRRDAIQVRPSVVEASSYWLAQRLISGDLDCAILTEPATMRDWLVEPLWVEALCLVGPAASPFAALESCTVAEIAELPLTLTPLPDNSRQVIEQVFRRQGLAPRVQQEHEALNLLKEQTRFGAYSILPRIQARELARELYLSVPVRDLAIRRGFVTRRGALPPRVAAMLLAVVRETARREMPCDPWFRMGWDGLPPDGLRGSVA